MAAGSTVRESQLQRIIRDLLDAVGELVKEYKESGEPITDDSTNLHKFAYKLEYLLQFDQKEKTTFLGPRKDYWDYFSDCLAKIKGANDGIRFVKSIAELKTSLGKGRAFIRYSLVHQRLADTLQQCLLNQRVTSDWYYARSPFLKPHLSVDIISHLYELNEVQFDVASRGHDLDASWPTFARRTLGIASSPAHMWKAPSRCSSINSLASSYSQQAPEFPGSPDYGQGLLNDLNGSLPACSEDVSAVEDLRMELDQSELKQRELLDRMQQLGEEAAELRGVVVELQRQLDISLAAQEEKQGLQGDLRALKQREEMLNRELEAVKTREAVREAEHHVLQEKLSAAEGKNVDLLAKLDGVLNEKGQQAARDFDSAHMIHELLDKLKEAEKGKIEVVAELEEKKRQVEKLVEELKVREATASEREKRLEASVASSSEEKVKLEAKLEERHSAFDNLQGALTLREKEASSLQKQLQDCQRSLEEKEEELLEVKKRAEKDVGDFKECSEAEVAALKEQLNKKEAELTFSCQTLQQLEARNQSLTTEMDTLTTNINDMEAKAKEQALKTEHYKLECANLMELNEKLLTTVKSNEELMKEMAENKALIESELVAARASEKRLRGQLDDTKMTVNDKETKLREENLNLDETLQRAVMSAELSEATSKRLEQENQSLREEQNTVKGALNHMHAELKSVHVQIEELEKNLGVSHRNETSLQEQLKAKEAQLETEGKILVELQSRVNALETKEKELEKAKAHIEATCARQTEIIERVTAEKQTIEKSQLERNTMQAKEKEEVTSKLAVLEAQLEMSMKNVQRLQDEILDLRVQVEKSKEENLKCQAQLQMSEAQRDELRTLTEQLKAQAEELNEKHVRELLERKHREDALIKEHDEEASVRAELSISEAVMRSELSSLKVENDRLALENSETREGLHRANTEMAELGMNICALIAEKEQTKNHRAEDATRIKVLEKEVERLEDSIMGLQMENTKLREELTQSEKLPGSILELQEQLEKANNQVKTLRDSSREEIKAFKFQMSSESMTQQNQIKNVTEQLAKVKAQLQEERKNASILQAKVSELQAGNEQYLQLTVKKDAQIAKSEATIRESESEIQQLKDSLKSAENSHSDAQMLYEELKQKLETLEADRKSQYLKMSAEIDDLSSIKTNLEERLIELIKDKDALWQKSDALEFEQKLRAEERWWMVDQESTHCYGCQGQFSFWLRRHHCRLCGRIFCYYCSNNFVMTRQSGKKERCCKVCYSQHRAVVERFTVAELTPADTQPPPPHGPGPGPQTFPEPAPYKPTPSVTVSESSNISDDSPFDFITEEEVNDVYDSETISHNIGGTTEGEEDQRSPGAQDTATEEELVPTVQDSEINLLKSGDVTMAVPLNIDDISEFGETSRELFIKSSCYSVITIAVGECGQTIRWMFSSEPKSIAFSVVYRQSADSQVEQSKVLIPLTRCNSHEEKIQGQLKVRHPGLYTLIFDNSFSRFISKKVFYCLTMENPIIYDGSDLS